MVSHSSTAITMVNQPVLSHERDFSLRHGAGEKRGHNVDTATPQISPNPLKNPQIP